MPSGLIVDDDKYIREMIPKLAEPLACIWTASENGGDALKLCFDNRFDIVICNWHMPEMDGCEFVRHIRSLAGYQVTPVLFFTGDEKAQAHNKCFDGDSNITWVLKNDGVEALLNTLDESLKTQVETKQSGSG